MHRRLALAALLSLAFGCGRSCGAPKDEPTVVTIPAFGQWPALQMLFELDPKPVAPWDVTPVANAVYLAARACPQALEKRAFTVRFLVADGKLAAAPPHPGGDACLEGAVVGKDVTSPVPGTFRIVANVVALGAADAGR